MKTRIRVKLNYNPAFPGPIEGYVVNFLKRNFWRISSSMEYEDALQEAYIVFLRLVRRYPDVVEAKHFMSLYKTSWGNTFTDLANLDNRLRDVASTDAVDVETESVIEHVGETECAGGVLIALEQAPCEVKQVLNLLISAPVELLELAHNAWKGNGHNVANGNELINKALGRPHGTDSIGSVRKYFVN